MLYIFILLCFNLFFCFEENMWTFVFQSYMNIISNMYEQPFSKMWTFLYIQFFFTVICLNIFYIWVSSFIHLYELQQLCEHFSIKNLHCLDYILFVNKKFKQPYILRFFKFLRGKTNTWAAPLDGPMWIVSEMDPYAPLKAEHMGATS